MSVRQPKSLEDRETGKQFAPLWRVLADQLKILFLDEDYDDGAFIVPAFDARSQVLSIKDRRNGVGKPVFKLAPFGNGQLFDLATPDLRVPGIPDDALQRIICQSQPSGPGSHCQSVMAALSLPRFLAAWRVEAPLSAVSLFGGLYNLRSLWLNARPYKTQRLVPGKIPCTIAVARMTPCLASSVRPNGLGKVNPY